MNQKVLPGSEKSSVFGRKRLPRHDPHLWADRLEDWFARLTWHVGMLYILVGSSLARTVWDILGWLDAWITGRL
jgi:hypothetical protein